MPCLGVQAKEQWANQAFVQQKILKGDREPWRNNSSRKGRHIETLDPLSAGPFDGHVAGSEANGRTCFGEVVCVTGMRFGRKGCGSCQQSRSRVITRPVGFDTSGFPICRGRQGLRSGSRIL